MYARRLLTLLFLTASRGFGSPETFDCALRVLALEFALDLQPNLTALDAQQIADALNGSPEFGDYNCNVTPPVGLPRSRMARVHSRITTTADHGNAATAEPTFYVDATRGSDSGTGTQGSPFRSIVHAITATRASPLAPRTLLLRGGTYYLGSPEQGGATIVLSAAEDSLLTIAAFPGEEVWVSGATPLANLVWGRVQNVSGNVWRAAVNLRSVPALRANGARLIRARFPNADPELGFGSSLVPTAWLPPTPLPLPAIWTERSINRTDMNNGPSIQFYTLGVGGGCAAYDPPAGFWCSNETVRFSGLDAEPRWPRGMTAGRDVLPHGPYADPSGAIIHAWHGGHWFTHAYVVGGYDADGNITFSGGGFQGGEGEDESAEFYVENVVEELDAPGEWFFDAAAGQLTLWWNATDGVPPPANGSLAVPVLRELFNVTGSQAEPVVGVTFAGIGFRDTAPSYLQPHGLPSGGDWALARTGALFFEGTVNVTVDGCDFERLDGTAVFISGFARGATVTGSRFSWLGESAIALWGWGEGAPVPRMGPNLTGGHIPLGTRIVGNICREIGVFQKQSSCVFQAEAGLSRISQNIMYNGPRAAINFNEDSVGGSVIERNVGFNFCRESGDHGVFNSWGRLPYLHDALGTGTPTTQKLWDAITGNLFIANYNAMAALDHDDASAYYNSSFNVFAYSPFGLKSDFGGHDNLASHSVYAYLRDTDWFDGPAAVWITFGSQFVGHADAFHDNLVVQDWCSGPCGGSNMTIGQVCNVSSSAAAHVAGGIGSGLVPLSAPPPPGTLVTLSPAASLGSALRHCDYVAYVTPRGIGEDDDYVFNVTAPLNGAAGALSFSSKGFPDHFLAVTDDAGTMGIVASPSPADASWHLTDAVGGDAAPAAFTLSPLTTRPSLAGTLLTRANMSTGPCRDEAGFTPPQSGDARAAAPGSAAAQRWTFYTPPVPPPPPGIAVTDMHDNEYYLPAGSGGVFECGLPIADYQASCTGCDPGSRAYAGWPEDGVLLDAARVALGIGASRSTSG